MDVVAFVIIIIGAVIGYKADLVYKLVKQAEPNEKQLIILKLTGLMITIIGIGLVFYVI